MGQDERACLGPDAIELMPPLCVTGEVAYVNATSLFWVGLRLQEV